MDSKIKTMIFKIMLWKDVLSIPVYTVIYNNFKSLFWILLILDRLVTLILFLKVGYIEEFIDTALESENLKDKQLIFFTMISSLVLYCLLFVNNRNLFYIVALVEMADFIVIRLIKD